MVSILLSGCRIGISGQQGGQHLPQSALPGALTNKVVRVTELPVMGDRKSALALIEVTDYQCPYCQLHYRETLPLLKQEFVDAGRLDYYILDYPSPVQEYGAQAAEAASCAEEQRAFWQFHDFLFEHSSTHSRDELLAVAEDLGLDIHKFETCLDARDQDSFLEHRRSTALGLGIQGTPTFILGRLHSGRLVTDIAVLPGMQSIETFREVIGRYEKRAETGI